ncbi:MAG TPA: thiamine pyrophosphate-dependent enzyme [Candidatus Limnocylindrales bacterium]
MTEPTPAELLRRMLRIRAFEEKVSELYARGKVAGLLHLGIGQEAVAVGVMSVLRANDAVVGGHRAHAHALATGADPVRLMAEIAGRSGGYAGGKGGSMHLVATDSGFLTATGVVGGNIPLALGAAFASTYAGSDAVAVVFFGDGAGQTGPFHESLNLASLWSLPVVFVCENNGYAEFTPLSSHTKVERLSAYAATYGMPAATIDGNDIDAVRTAAADAVARARSGGGPTFVEALTYRLRGHYEGDPAKYRELSELADWKAKDPIERLRTALASSGAVDEATAVRIEADERAAIEEAATKALASPPPDPGELVTRVYA